MNFLIVLGIIIFVIYSCVSWLLPSLLAWLFKRKYHIKLKIGRIAVPKLVLKDVNLSKDGYSVHINELSLKSSFFNSEINKLLSVIIKDVDVTNNVEEKRSMVVETILKPLLSKQNSRSDDMNQEYIVDHNELGRKLGLKKCLDFREKKLPHSLIMFAQFMGLHIFNISVTIVNSSHYHPWSFYARATELHADGAAGGPTKALVFSANIVEAKAKMVAKDSQKSLGEGSCSVLVEGTVKADGPLNVEKLHTSIINPTLDFEDELYSFWDKHKKLTTKKPRLRFEYEINDDAAPFIDRLSPVIPKIFSLKIDTTTIRLADSITKTNFQLSLHSVQINSRFSATSIVSAESDGSNVNRPQVYVAYQMDELLLRTDVERLFYLNKLKLDAKLEKGVLNLYLIFSTMDIIYNHRDVFKWYSSALQRLKSSKSMEIKDGDRKALPRWLTRPLSLCVVQGCAEVQGATLAARVQGHDFVAGCGGLKLKLDQLLDTREEPYASELLRLILGSRHWSAELLLDSWWAGVGGEGAAPPRRAHRWGTALLAVALVKWGSHGPRDSKVEAMMDCLRLEWSDKMSETILAVFDCLQEYKSIKTSKRIEIEQQESLCNVSINVALSHINLFLIVSESICLMTRIDAISIDKNSIKSVAMLSGLKVVDMVPYKGSMPCQRTEEIPITFFHVKLARIDYIPSRDKTSKLLEVQLLEIVDMEWSANLHLKVLTLVRSMKSFNAALKEQKGQGDAKLAGKKKTALDWKVSFKNDTSLGLLLSNENNMFFVTDDMSISYTADRGLSLQWSHVKMVLNGDDVMTVEGFHLERLEDDHDVRVERKASDGLTLEWNRVWGVTIDSIRLIFPYKHRFAEAVQGDFVSLFKWLKMIHGIRKKPFTADSPLPSDLYIRIEELLIEMSDDPFEVKLRDNYELLEDEYKESQKRRTMLDSKVQELTRSHRFLSAGKVEELYSALDQKDAQIYVQRCRAAPPPRTRLVACSLSGLKVMALADPAMHGAQNVEAKLRDIDYDSPIPEEGVEYSTLWWRSVWATTQCWELLLRDFPQPLLRMQSLRCWGALLAAEQAPPPRAVRTVRIDQGEPWGECKLERSMMPLKFYYDLCCEVNEMSYAFGPCWEPVIAQCNLAFDQVSRPSLDPSQPLAWWDKVRLLMHGRMTANFKKFTCLLHVSLDPYNTTEEMEVTWNDLVLDWTNGKLCFLGELNVFVRTASKYDDCRVLRVPGLRLGGKLGWGCVGDPRDHAAAPTAPDRLPEYSSNQEHDSYRAFRSQSLDLHLSLETKPMDNDGPVLLLYGSTLRWFESLKLILSGITRPTRRGRVFGAVRPRKPQLSRHYRNVSVSLTLHNLQVFYWSSSSMQRGIEILGLRVTCGSKHSLTLVPCNDGLIRRPRANWTTVYMNCDLNDSEIWLKSATAPPEGEKEKDADSEPSSGRMEKYYCVSVRRVSYGRAAGGGAEPAHRLAVHDLRGAWTKRNRDLAFALIDTYIKTQQLKKNLSTKALKEEEKPSESPVHQREADVVSPPPSANQSGLAGGERAAGLLAALVAGAGGEAPVVFSDELNADPQAYTHHRPLLDDDTAHTHCLIELVNSQVVLKGCETRGYVVVCAARAVVRQRVRRAPPATAWAAALSAMQYYATVTPNDHQDRLDENIQWVSVEEIEERCPDPGSVPKLVGSGHSAGSVIGMTVGPSADAGMTQLQRIVSRCACEFYLVSAEAADGAPVAHQEPYDSFTLMHQDLDVCTNSLQYTMLLDVINNVVLHVEPERRRTLERRARMRFQLQLQRDHDPRHLIHKLQTQVRESLARLRRLEKEYYLKNRSLNRNDPSAIAELKTLDNQVNECKESVWSLGEELDAMVVAWRERRRSTPRPAHAPPHRHHDICFKSARWRLTDADGQLGIADLLLTNFLYTKTSRADDTVEHQLELGYVKVTNLLPNEPFPEVLVPHIPSGRAPVSRRAALRVFCRDRPPVGGISVKEHFEVNIVPIKIGLTKKFFNTMLKFCFPERDPDAIEEGEDEAEGNLKAGASTSSLVSTGSKKTKKKAKDSNSNFYVKRDKTDKDDVEKMKERAEKNKLFIYIKIPEVPVRVSYKGNKEKNLEDVRDLPLVLPTLEYHNVTWTWLDLLMATKSDTRRVILSQAIRQKLQLHRRAAAAPEPQEEDKARLLLGEKSVTESKPHKKSTPSVFKFSKS